jgi:hypothetical protein
LFYEQVENPWGEKGLAGMILVIGEKTLFYPRDSQNQVSAEGQRRQ